MKVVGRFGNTARIDSELMVWITNYESKIIQIVAEPPTALVDVRQHSMQTQPNQSVVTSMRSDGTMDVNAGGIPNAFVVYIKDIPTYRGVLRIREFRSAGELIDEYVQVVQPREAKYRELNKVPQFEHAVAVFGAFGEAREESVGERYDWGVSVVLHEKLVGGTDVSEEVELGTCAPFQVSLATTQVETARGAFATVKADVDIFMRSLSVEAAQYLLALEREQANMEKKRALTGRTYKGVAQVKLTSQNNRYEWVYHDVAVLGGGNLSSAGLTDNSADNRNAVRLVIDKKASEVWRGLIRLQ